MPGPFNTTPKKELTPEKKLSKKEQKALQQEEKARLAEEELKTERERLMQLSEKELLVEILIGMKDFDSRISSLEEKSKSTNNMTRVALLNTASFLLKR